MPTDYLRFDREYAPNTVFDNARAQEHSNGERFDNSEPCTNTYFTDPYEHWYDNVDGHCLLYGNLQTRVVTWINWLATLL